MKIAITYYGKVRDSLWSGTFLNLENSLGRFRGIVEIEWISILPKVREFVRLLLVVYCRLFFYGDGICREKHIYWRVWRKAFKEVKKSNSTWVLMVAEHCLTDRFPKEKKYACYIDSDFYEISKYSPLRKRYGYKFYVGNYDKYTKKSLENMDLIFTQNEWTKSSIVARYGIPCDKVYNVRFGVNVSPYMGEKKYEDDLLIVLREYNHYVKGLDLIVSAMPIILKKYPSAKLHVVGNSVFQGREGVCCYVNYPREKTIELFNRASLYVMPSRNEPNGITYLEALANRTPFVALDRFATKEFSGNGRWSFLCEDDTSEVIAKVVCDALSDKQRLSKMGEEGQSFVLNNYNWDYTVDTMLDLMRNYKPL